MIYVIEVVKCFVMVVLRKKKLVDKFFIDMVLLDNFSDFVEYECKCEVVDLVG